ncbi:MAG TPA: hypothetical protein VEB23_13430 [Ramlibacter sp.]|nr:hypothetical protein [Ramlibacter sp.]
MPEPLRLYPFKYRDPLTGRWVKARYKAEIHELEQRYPGRYEITGPPEERDSGGQGFMPPGTNSGTN